VSDDTLPVHINRESLHSLEVPDAFEAEGAFDIALRNHGTALHVHLHLDDALSEVATVDAANHYIDGESERAVRVAVDGDVPARGRLKVVSAYGAETRYVDLSITEPEEEDEPVEVDESLAEPATLDPEPQQSAPLAPVAENPEIVAFALGVLALVVALAAALLIQNVVVLVGALVVLAAVLVAMYLLVRE